MAEPSLPLTAPGTRPVDAAPAGVAPPAATRRGTVEGGQAVPWWRVGTMWFVVGGLGAVVIGSFAMLATAIIHPDAVLPQVAVVKGPPTGADAPAIAARNHAATPRAEALQPADR
jgi:hypothetical protein